MSKTMTKPLSKEQLFMRMQQGQIEVGDFVWVEMREGCEKGVEDDELFHLRIADLDAWMWVAHPMGLTDLLYEEYGKKWRIWFDYADEVNRLAFPWG